MVNFDESSGADLRELASKLRGVYYENTWDMETIQAAAATLESLADAADELEPIEPQKPSAKSLLMRAFLNRQSETKTK